MVPGRKTYFTVYGITVKSYKTFGLYLVKNYINMYYKDIKVFTIKVKNN